jgi:hypothetical protein
MESRSDCEVSANDTALTLSERIAAANDEQGMRIG